MRRAKVGLAIMRAAPCLSDPRPAVSTGTGLFDPWTLAGFRFEARHCVRGPPARSLPVPPVPPRAHSTPPMPVPSPVFPPGRADPPNGRAIGEPRASFQMHEQIALPRHPAFAGPPRLGCNSLVHRQCNQQTERCCRKSASEAPWPGSRSPERVGAAHAAFPERAGDGRAGHVVLAGHALGGSPPRVRCAATMTRHGREAPADLPTSRRPVHAALAHRAPAAHRRAARRFDGHQAAPSGGADGVGPRDGMVRSARCRGRRGSEEVDGAEAGNVR